MWLSRIVLRIVQTLPLLSDIAKLKLGQTRVKFIASDQFNVVAYRHDTAVVHDHDAVNFLDRGQAVRNHQRGAVLHQTFQRRLHETFTFRVQ